MSRRKKLLLSAAVIWLAATIIIGAVLLLVSEKGLPALAAAAPAGDIKHGAQVTVIDVGQGSSLLIRLYDEDNAVLIDAGDSFAGDDVCRALKKANIDKIDLLVITHPHTDHFGGAVKVMEKYKVNELWLPLVTEKLEPTNSSYLKFLQAVEAEKCSVALKSRAETVRFSDKASLSLLDGFVADPEDLNDSSLCLRLDYGEASFLITGDAEKALEQQLLKNKSNVDSDVYVAAHHGSSSSNTTEFLNAVSPKVSAISVGKDNEYDLPSGKIIDRLSQFGNLYRTDINGDVSFLTDGKDITVYAGEITDFINAGGN